MSKIKFSSKFYVAIILSIAFAFASNAVASLTLTDTAITGSTASTLIGGTSTTSDLFLKTTTGVGTTGADMHFLVGNNGSTEAITILNSGNVGIGSTAPTAPLFVSGRIHSNSATLAPASGIVPGGANFLGTNDSSVQFTGVGASNTSNVAGFYLRSVRARGTIDTPLVVQTGDTLLTIESDVWNGTARAGGIATQEALAEAVSGSDISGHWRWSTHAIGVGGLVERMRLTAGGNLGIGTVTPNANAILDVSSTTKAFMPPRMTKAQRDAIASPAASMTVYQTDNTPGLRVYNGTNWMRFTETAD